MKKHWQSFRCWQLGLLIVLTPAALLSSPLAHGKVTINVVIEDADGEGFNDTTPAAPVGGNNGTTVGEQRTNALQYAVDVLASVFHSDFPITITATFDNLGGSAFAATLGAAGPSSVHFNFDGAPAQETYYVQALANKLNGDDLSASPDITATFNSDVDGTIVLGSDQWYYGLDRAPSGMDLDFVSVALHELLHGFGFLTMANLNTGQKFNNRDDMFSSNLYHIGASPGEFPLMSNAGRVQAATASDLLVVNAAAINQAVNGSLAAGTTNNMIQIYAPNPLEIGSSVSHFSDQTFPNQLMEPNYDNAIHEVGHAAAVLADAGWGNLADLAISLNSDTSFSTINTATTFTLTASNVGQQSSPATTVTVSLPNAASLISITPQGVCSTDSGITCTLGSLEPFTETNITFTALFSSGGTFELGAEIYGEIVETTPGDNSVTLDYGVILGGSSESGPTAEAGSDTGVPIGEVVTFSGRDSAGATAPITAYQWTQLSGPTVVLNNANTDSVSFTVPNTSEQLTLQLQVVDSALQQSTDSVTLSPGYAPSAEAGDNLTLNNGQSAQLSGATAADTDGQVAAYSWQQVSGSSTITFDDTSSLSPIVTASGTSGTATLELTVTDNQGLSASDTLLLTVASVSAGSTANGSESSSSANIESGGGGGSSQLFWLLVLLGVCQRYKHLTQQRHCIQ